jgi:hypothetical protein
VGHGHADPPTLPLDGAVRLDRGDHGAALAVLPEDQEVRVAGVGVSGGVARAVIMADHDVMEAGCLDLRRIERSVRLLAHRVGPEAAAFGRVHQSEVDARPIDLEPVQEPERPGWGAVSSAPER